MIKNVFDETCKRYENILKNYYPSFDLIGFTERNLTFNFCNSFFKIANNDELVIWQEVPIKNQENNAKKEHFDSLIINERDKSLFLIEAKRLNSKTQFERIEADIQRMRDKWDDIKFSKNYDEKTFSKYLIVLADIWIPYKNDSKAKKALLEKFKFKTENEFLYYLEIQKDGKSLTENEQYFLLCKIWKI
jgi:hypothetical protein